MLVQTIQSEFDDGTEDIIVTLKKLFEYPIQPVKRAYIQACFTYESTDAYASSVLQKKQLSFSSSVKPVK